MSMNYKKRKRRIVFFGDSITEQGMRFGGYIKHIQQLLQQEGVEDDYELVGAGNAGDKIYDLHLRMQDDILSKGADVVVIYIGTNDVWHKYSKLTGTSLTTFEDFYLAIIEKLLTVGIKVVLCTPAVIGEEKSFSSAQDEDISAYCDLIRKLAAQYELPLVDLRKSFVGYNLVHNPENLADGILTSDGVHLNVPGNQLVAEEIWKVLTSIYLN